MTESWTGGAPEETRPPLEVRLFGTFEAWVRGTALPPLRSRTCVWLFGYLCLAEGRPVDRVHLAGLLWPDSAHELALANLRRALTDLRRALGPEASRLRSHSRTVTLDLEGARVDAATFDRLVSIDDLDSLERAAELYRGPLLEACDGDWIVAARSLRADRYVALRRSLGDGALDRNDAPAAIRHFKAALRYDPLSEPTYQQLMTAHARHGDPASVALAYRELRHKLNRELQTEPSASTIALFERLRRDARALRVSPDAAARIRVSSAPVPSLPGAFVGREHELARAAEWTLTNRQLTIKGPAGIGKTRLAVELATALRDALPGAQWFIDLDDASGHGAFAAKMNDALRANGPTLLDRIAEQPAVVVFDGCEGLLDETAAFVERLLHACPRVRVIVTSREPLNLRAETLFVLDPLAVPASDHVDVVASSDSTKLLLSRVQSSARDLRVTPANARWIGSLCRRLGGVPLAIELAAARLRSMTVRDVAAELDGPAGIATLGLRTSSRRNASITASVGPSIDALGARERNVFVKLAALEGWFDRHDARAMLDDALLSMPELSHHLATLFRQSLLMMKLTDENVCYKMTEPTRAFLLTEAQGAVSEIHPVRSRQNVVFLDVAAANGERIA